MGIKISVSLAFTIHLLLGNLCMMPVAYAQEITGHGAHAHREMVMTPVVPMSPADCRFCMVVELKQSPPFSIPCDNGNCVSDAPVTLSAAMQNMVMQETLPPSPVITLLPPETASSAIASSNDPPPAFRTQTIVLLL